MAASATIFDYAKDNPTAPFTVFNRDGNRVTIPAGQYAWGQNVLEYLHNPSARVTGTFRYRFGHYYDGDFNGFEFTSDYRITPKATASAGWTRQDIRLPYGSFVNNLVPIKGNYSFTTLINLSALLQYNGQTGLFSSNVRFAWLNRSGTGLFVVYNDRRDVLSSTALETLGRSFVVKYTRLDRFLNPDVRAGLQSPTRSRGGSPPSHRRRPCCHVVDSFTVYRVE